jgi:hypothetical protein
MFNRLLLGSLAEKTRSWINGLLVKRDIPSSPNVSGFYCRKEDPVLLNSFSQEESIAL